MILARYVLVLLMISLVCASADAAECDQGTRTSLQISRINVPVIPRHDQSTGETQFVLSGPGGEELLNRVYDGIWFCIGFNRNTKTYVVGGISEIGAWLPLTSIQYVREGDRSFVRSAFDRLRYLAMTVVVSPARRYIVFIGGQHTSGTLYVLDIERDVIKKLGPAPAPPPNELARDICKDEPFVWGTCWADGYVDMDAGIIRFTSENVLEVSYGNDRPTARAKKRWARRFELG